MINVSEFNTNMLDKIHVPTINTNRKITYLNIESSFDIETSSVKFNDGTKSSFMYIWMFGIGYLENVYYGRTWEEFKQFSDEIVKYYGLNTGKRIIIYVHNLGYEFQFMRKYFDWEDVFSIGERKPLKAVTKSGIEFRCSYMLSGFSLERTADNLQKHSVSKMVGDLDYSLIRTQHTELSQKEMLYCERDIDVVNAYINEQIEQYGDVNKIPLTNTGRVRNYVRHECYYTSNNHRKTNKGKYFRYRKIMDDLTLKEREYKMLKRAFMGGFTHANAFHSGKLLENVTSVDFTSSYPSVMLAEKFPMSRGRLIAIKSIDELEKMCVKYCLLFDIKLTGVTPKINHENYISESKCHVLTNPTINNGRVFSADELQMTITNVDYDIIKQCYDWETISVSNATRYHKAYLPKSIIESVLKLFQDKTVLKGVKGKEVEYTLSKGMLNSIYGMSVTDVVKDEHTYNDGWGVEIADVGEQVDKYNTSKNRFLYYPWGVWITAYARKNLWTGILALENDYVYSDTDSIKLLNYEAHTDYFNWYDSNLKTKLTQMMEHYKLDVALLSPKTIEGKVESMGVWDYEGTYSRFKTLGAKRYLVEENGELALTVAGLSKQNGLNYLLEKANYDNGKVFDMFNDELYIPSERTGKMTHTYIDETQDFIIQDYQGNESLIHTKSGIHLEPCDFTLSISKQYGKFIKNFIQGYIFEGVQYK